MRSTAVVLFCASFRLHCRLLHGPRIVVVAKLFGAFVLLTRGVVKDFREYYSFGCWFSNFSSRRRRRRRRRKKQPTPKQRNTK